MTLIQPCRRLPAWCLEFEAGQSIESAKIPCMQSSPARAVCPNCATEISGPFCPTCGQEQKELKKYVWTIAGEFFEDVFTADSRASRTLVALVFRPGHLTTEYFAGHRARYVAPVRLYLIISFLFFIILPLLSQLSPGNDRQVQVSGADSQEQNWREEVDAEMANVRIGWLSEEENAALTEKLRSQVSKLVAQIDENPASVYMEFMDLMSAVMFFLLPFFAIFLKFFYIGSGFYYAEHLLLAIHNHCFLYLALTLSSLLGYAKNGSWANMTSTLETIVVLWMPVYLYLSMRRVYGQGHFVTALKFLVIGTCYFVLALMGFILTVIAGLWLA